MKNLKIKLIVSNLLLILAVALLVGTTIAYFTDTKTISNTLTSGTVKIELTEAAVKKDAVGDLVENTEAPRIFGTADATVHDYGTVWPGQSIFKDPTIHNIGENDAWIAVEVAFADGDGKLEAVLNSIGKSFFDLLGGALLDEPLTVGEWNGLQNVRYNSQAAIITKETQDGCSVYFLFNQPLAKGKTATAFNKLTIPAEWTSEDMAEIGELKIHVQGYGVQTYGFGSCYNAMTVAFPDHFDFD